MRGPEINLPVHLQHDSAIDDGEAEHPDPAQQDAPEGAGPEVHDEDLQRHWPWVQQQSRQIYAVLQAGECDLSSLTTYCIYSCFV